MEINKALSVINAKCGDFSSLPNEMKETVNKAELETYLIKTEEIEKEVDINTRHLKLYDSFLNVIEGSFKNPAEYMYLGMPDYDKLKKMVDILEKSQKGQRLAKGLDKEENNNENLNKVEQLLTKIKEEANK